MNTQPTIAISRCLLGDAVRYDGGHKHAPNLLQTLEGRVRFIPLCPEAEVGLGIPRPPMRLESHRGRISLKVIEDGQDHTDRMLAYADQRTLALIRQGVDGFILKARSPSCGKAVPLFVNGEAGSERVPGLFAARAQRIDSAPPIADEEELESAQTRTRFLAAAQAHFLARVGHPPVKG